MPDPSPREDTAADAARINMLESDVEHLRTQEQMFYNEVLVF